MTNELKLEYGCEAHMREWGSPSSTCKECIAENRKRSRHVLPYWKVFRRVHEIDACFVVDPLFSKICGILGLREWSDVVWIGRLFARDQDFGEHWFDNWEEREELEEQAKLLGYDYEELLIVLPERFTESDCYCIHCFDPPKCNETEGYKYLPCPKCGKNIRVGPDGPCYSDEVKKRFWIDALDSLHLTSDTLLAVAKLENEKRDPDKQIPDLEERFKRFDDAHALGVLDKVELEEFVDE